MSKRCFISIDITDEEIRQQLKKAQQNLSQYGRTTKTNPSQFHITLNFIGNVKDDEIQTIHNQLSTIEQRVFNAKLRGIGVFPSLDFIKVIWAGAQGKELKQLADTVRDKLDEDHVQNQDFHGHITLLRVKNISPEEKHELQKTIPKYKTASFDTFTVETFSLKQSKQTEDGAIHTTLHEYTLQ